MKLILLSIFLFFFTFTIFAQNQKEINKIISTYDLIKIEKLKIKLEKKFKIEEVELLQKAKENNWPLSKIDKNGFRSILWKISSENKPIYLENNNSIAARSTRASFLHNNGGLGLNIEGQGMNIFMWDIDHPLTNHTEFMDNGTSRIIIADTPSAQLGDHATHVIGTLMAKGQSINAKGMAPMANGYALTASNDQVEVLSAINVGMLLSNHSYGPSLQNLPDWTIGAYVSDSALWDEIMFDAPYYLRVNAAGNDGNDNNSNGDPLNGVIAYDKLNFDSTAKNGLVVANGNDLVVDNQGGISGNTRVSSSSEGPTDDFRIKPDITGNGWLVYSPISTSVNSYDSFVGTSMASPNVCGSLLLLQQLYNQENSNFMLAATLKGLALHTADDSGPIGPDALYGWGFMDTKHAAEIILNNNEIIDELTINNNESYNFTVTTIGTEPLMASISWTDPKGIVNTGTANDTTPVLVNDLDIRITRNATTYFPWKLTNVYSNDQGDNIVDPFEKIEIDNPGVNTYNISISHKGSLENNLQNFSLVISGISSNTLGLDQTNLTDFNISPNPSNGIIYIALNNNFNNKSKIIITNTIGQIVSTNIINSSQNNFELDLSQIEKGLYYITFINGNSKTIKKIILK